MKTFIAIALTVGACTAPFAARAAGLTRAQVYADLVRVEQAGYVPGAGDDANYPSDIQDAEAKIAAADEAARLAQRMPADGMSQTGTGAGVSAP